MSSFCEIIVFLLIIASEVHMETKDAKCEDPTKFCENIWYCKINSYPDKYEACGHDGLVDRVCCDPKYKPTKSRKYCDTIHHRHERDEYGNEHDYKMPIPINSQYIAALGHRNESSTDWLCAGSLISNKFVLTAATCVFNKSINVVRLGDGDLTSNTDRIEAQEYGVLRYIVHPKYKYPFVYNDIALIELNATVKFTYFVKPICINDDARIMEANWAEIGYKEAKAYLVQVFSLYDRACDLYFGQDRFANLVPFGLDQDTLICGSSPTYHSTCQGSFGAPLQYSDLNYFYANFLIGITVIRKPCSDTNEPGLYTRVSHYAPWIESYIFPDD